MAMSYEFERDKPPDLRQETFDLLGTLRGPSPQERKALGEQGFIFFTVYAKPLGQILAEEREYFKHVHPSKGLRFYTPPQDFKVAIKPREPRELRLPRSNISSRAGQLRMIAEYSRKQIETEVPGAKAIMLPATGYAQLDIAFQKQHDGEKLFKDFRAQALDTTVGSIVASVGRGRPDDPLSVESGWNPFRVWAVPAVVFPRK